MSISKQTANLGDVAQALGVSVATVSNALSGKGRVSAELIPRIRETAARLGYVPSPAARALRTGRSNVLGLVLPDIASPLFPQIAQAIEFAANQAGYGVLIADSRGDVAQQTSAINRLVARDVDGLVVVPRRGTRIVDMGCPVAVIDSPSTPGNTVSADHWQGGQLIGVHLAALGHRKVVLIGNNPTSNVQNDRIGGMRAGLGAGVEATVLWIERHEAQHGPGAPLGLGDWAARGFTGFAAVSDIHALRAMTELNRAGLRVPEAVSVTGFDDLLWSAAIIPPLTTVRTDLPLLAEIAIASLVRVIDGKAKPETGIVPSVGVTRVPMSLIVRETSAALSNPSRRQSNDAPVPGVGPC